MSSPSKKDAESEWIDVARADAVPVSSDKDTDDPPLLPTTDEMPKPPPVELLSRIVGEYEVLSPLGSGGMGEVFKARHRRLNKLVALKLLPTDSQHLREAAARFQREMKAVGDLDHPNVVEDCPWVQCTVRVLSPAPCRLRPAGTSQCASPTQQSRPEFRAT